MQGTESGHDIHASSLDGRKDGIKDGRWEMGVLVLVLSRELDVSGFITVGYIVQKHPTEFLL
jgi:hypothetical protein